MFSISQTGSFEASHFITKDGTDDHYKHLHGHSFVVAVQCSKPDIKDAGWVLDLGVLKTVLDEVLALLDHKILNEVDGLADPTLESILVFIDANMRARGLTPSQLTIGRPTMGQSAIYTPQRV